MSHNSQFYINGAWVDPVVAHPFDVIDPSNEDAFAQISLGSKADVDKAVTAAKRAFATYGFTSPAERLALLERIVEVYKKRAKDLALAVSREMGAPRAFALSNQVGIGQSHLEKMIEVLKSFEARGVDFVAKVLPCGHYTTGETPYKYIDGWYLGSFVYGAFKKLAMERQG